MWERRVGHKAGALISHANAAAANCRLLSASAEAGLQETGSQPTELQAKRTVRRFKSSLH